MGKHLTILRGTGGNVTIKGVLSIKECRKLSTSRLLTYYKKYRRILDIKYENPYDMRKYSQYIIEVKELLDDREHIK